VPIAFSREHIINKTIRVLIGHPRVLGTEGLARVLTSAGYRVVWRVANGDAVVDAALADDFDVVVLDSTLVDDEMSVIARLREGHERTLVLLVGETQPDTFVIRALMAGASGCVSFDDPRSSFLPRSNSSCRALS
jgi:two-component system, NarL family, response regulator EvgA